ncbi:MAG TPA: VWA domain-containing protein [Blastocatellia bacterium]|nr:VWA domain-containing protein [Blastocatellia bacterium]
MFKNKLAARMILSALTGVALLFGSGITRADQPAGQQDQGTQAGRDVTIPVTVQKKSNKRAVATAALKSDDFSVREMDRPQTIVSVSSPTQAPPIIEVLIQDDLTSRLDNEIKGIKQFIAGLPDGSRVLTGYVTAGSLSVAQDFTTDRRRAADSLRVIRGAGAGSPYNPYIELSEGLKRFDSQPAGRRVVLFISDGLDTSHGFWDADPNQSMDLNRAIRDAQDRSVAVFTFFAPGPGTHRLSMATNFGQGSLDRLTQETGGDAMFEGATLVTFSPFLKELQSLLNDQYLVTYHSLNTGAGFRPISVSTETGAKLLYQKGYWVK